MQKDVWCICSLSGVPVATFEDHDLMIKYAKRHGFTDNLFLKIKIPFYSGYNID